MDKKFENFKLKVSKLFNHYNAQNYKFVIQQVNLLLKKQPNNQFLLNLLGSSYHRLGKLQTAKKIFMSAIALDNSSCAALNNLANVYKDLSENKSAEELYLKVLKIDPNYINGINNYASLNFKLNRYEEAIHYYKKALTINNDSPLVHYNIGLVYQSLGKYKEATFHFKAVLKIDPNMNIIDRIMSRSIKYNEDDSHLKEMLEKIKNEKLNDNSKINLNFAIGKAYEDIKDYKKSFTYFDEGNKIKSNISNHDMRPFNKFLINIKNSFENYAFNNKTTAQNRNKKMIFIVGLPRSGTSLIEQIISSHSKVYGSGELDYLERLMVDNFYKDNELKMPNLEDEHSQELVSKISSKYHELINDFDATEENITDKAPLNFRWIGIIKILFPNSKIIHCSRNPKDNCLSIFKNFFEGGLNFGYNQKELGTYYNLYLDIMSFWKDQFPNTIYDAQYETIIENPENEIKKLIKFCNLDWEKDCLQFYNNKTPIKTISTAQARMPIYKSSKNSFKKFAPYLSDLNKLI